MCKFKWFEISCLQLLDYSDVKSSSVNRKSQYQFLSIHFGEVLESLVPQERSTSCTLDPCNHVTLSYNPIHVTLSLTELISTLLYSKLNIAIKAVYHLQSLINTLPLLFLQTYFLNINASFIKKHDATYIII